MTDIELIHSFESDIRAAGRNFHHSDHVRLAFAYLNTCPVLEALQKFSDALRRFAEARGKTRLYHETITCAYFFLIHERMARAETTNWEEFAASNPDLLIWRGGILTQYYAGATLNSELARTVFVLPDKSLKPLT